MDVAFFLMFLILQASYIIKSFKKKYTSLLYVRFFNYCDF